MSDTSKRNLLIAVVLIAVAFFALRPKKPQVETPEETGKPYKETPVAEAPPPPQKPPPAPKPAPQPVAPAAPAPRALNVSQERINFLRNQARSSLSAAYTAQRAFRAEFGRYTTDLKAAGWSPASFNLPYKMGFLSEFRANPNNDSIQIEEDPRLNSTDSFIGDRYDDLNSYRYDDAANSLSLSEFQHYCRQGCTAGDDSFEMVLAIPLGDAQHTDVWLINEKKGIELVQDGITGQPVSNAGTQPAPAPPAEPATSTADPDETSEPIDEEDARPGPNPQTISQ
jgi:hypothetical protein